MSSPQLGQELGPTVVRVLIFKGSRKWVAQCLEYDIAAQADTPDELTARFDAAMRAERVFSKERKLTPYARLPRAPQEYWDRWLEANRRQQEALESAAREPWRQISPVLANYYPLTAAGAPV